MGTLKSTWIGQQIFADVLDPSRGNTTIEDLVAQPNQVTLSCDFVTVADSSALVDACTDVDADLVFVSAAVGYEQDEGEPLTELCDRFTEQLLSAVTALGDRHVFVVIASTLTAPHAPWGSITDADQVFHARNLAAIDVAARTGVSIIDVDRLVSEVGGRIAVVGPCAYTDVLIDKLRAEIVRVLDDYRLLDPAARPVPQALVSAS